jgi:hypothetical protein
MVWPGEKCGRALWPKVRVKVLKLQNTLGVGRLNTEE